MMRIIINGCNGKMGRVLSQIASEQPDIEIVAGIDRVTEANKNPYPVYSSLSECPLDCDVIIDFSVPQALSGLLEEAVKRNIPLIIATTGHSEKDLVQIEKASSKIPIFKAANMSLGVNLMYELVQKAAQALGDSFDIEIIEKHHNQKIDSPSGTAYALADAINKVFLGSKNYVFGRHSKNDRRSPAEIGIHAVRGGTIVGEHTVIFAGNDEVLEITHTAQSKHIFAVGALLAARFIVGKSSGIYDMQDLLKEKSSVTNVYSTQEYMMVSFYQLPNNPDAINLLFKALADKNIIVDMISQTTNSNESIDICITVPVSEKDNVVAILKDVSNKLNGMNFEINDNIAKLTVEGPGMEYQSGIAAKVFKALARQGILVRAVSTSETKISCIIDKIFEKNAIEALIEAFNL